MVSVSTSRTNHAWDPASWTATAEFLDAVGERLADPARDPRRRVEDHHAPQIGFVPVPGLRSIGDALSIG
jgi:hypothetical protein